MPTKERYTAKEIKRLPRWGRIAVIARALRRVMPMIAEMLGKNLSNTLESIDFALCQSEDSAARGTLSEHLLWSHTQLAELARTVALESDDCDDESDDDQPRDMFVAAYLLTSCCIKGDPELELAALEAISNVADDFERFKRRKGLRKAADAMVVEDIDNLRNTFVKAELQFDSPVPLTTLGELWRKSRPKVWPSNPKENPATAKFRRPRSNRRAVSQLPAELIDFLVQNPDHSIESPSLECGRIVLNKPEYLGISEHLFSMRMTDESDLDPNRNTSGSYVLTTIELVCYCEHYSPAGRLCWFLEYACFGCYDSDLGTVYLFRGVSWKRFLARSDFFLNSPWAEPQRPVVELKNPWERLAFKKSRSAGNFGQRRSDGEIISELQHRKMLGTLMAGTVRDIGSETICRHKALDEMALSQSEKSLGCRLPPLLRRMYCEVANGGFGESYGLIGLVGGARDDTNRDVQQLFRDFRKPDRNDPKWSWPDGLLPMFHLGCAMYLCIDCLSSNGRIWLFEPNIHEDGRSWKSSFIPFSPSLRKMMDDWIDGRDLWTIAGIRI